MSAQSGTGERFLVTGALGCIGAWTVRRLLAEGVPVWAYDLPADPHRLRLVLLDRDLSSVNLVAGDITDLTGFEKAIADNRITHVVHLAALQVPFVRADPVRGAQVNVVGMAVLLEAVRRHGDQIQGLSYASSVGVYGPADRYPPGPLAHDAPLDPPTLYGVYKQADEGMARIYWRDFKLASVGLRPYVVYGPGRDQGMTSGPTVAMLAAAVGRPSHIGFGGTAVFQHADDAAAWFITAARTRTEGASVYNLGGTTASVAEIVEAIEEAAPSSAGSITFEPAPLPNPPEIDDTAAKATLGQAEWRGLRDGVRATVEHFRTAVKDGLLDPDRVLPATSVKA